MLKYLKVPRYRIAPIVGDGWTSTELHWAVQEFRYFRYVTRYRTSSRDTAEKYVQHLMEGDRKLREHVSQKPEYYG